MSQFGDGYVGSAEDSARIRRMDKKRQEERARFEKEQKARQDRIESAGLRKFDAATTEVGAASCMRWNLHMERVELLLCMPCSGATTGN